MVDNQEPEFFTGVVLDSNLPPTTYDQMEFINMTDSYIYFSFSQGHKIENNPIKLIL